MRSSPSSGVSAVAWPAAPARPASSFSAILCGEPPFDRDSLEADGQLPGTPHSILYCDELPGDTPLARGQALLAEIRQRKANGEFSVLTPLVISLHGTVSNGELLVGESQGGLSVPLQVLLHVLSNELFDPGAAPRGQALGPVILSGCHAGVEAPCLRDFPRPIIINGSDQRLFVEDAYAMFRASVELAEGSWRDGAPLSAAEWFDELSLVSGELMHRAGEGVWLTHDPIVSASALGSVSAQQASLIIRAKMMHGSVDDLAEALLLFGTAPLLQDGSLPAMHFLLDARATQMHAKVALLAAAGVDIDQPDAQGKSALHRACDPQDPKGGSDAGQRAVLARLLLANGARPDRPHASGRTPHMLAASGGQPVLQAAFDPQRTASDRPVLGAAGLRAAAAAHQWHNVLSLLDDPLQVMGGDEGGDEVDDDAGNGDRSGQIRENSDS